MVHLRKTHRLALGDNLTVVGIDVGGRRKGFHAVALTAGIGLSGRFATEDPRKLADWCREVGASVIAVDAPCRWSADGRARPAERALMAKGIWCFSTPDRARALAHPKDHFGWMLQGEALFEALRPTHPLCTMLPVAGRPCAFETFPHAIAWHLTGGTAVASRKRSERRALLAGAGVPLTELTNIDWIDAALCALTACHAAIGLPCTSYGEPSTGLIIVPEANGAPGWFGPPI